MAKAKREISVIERRLKSGSVFAAGSKPIPLTEPAKWTLRIVNTQISDARQWEMQAEKGWIYATPGDLAVQPYEVGFRELDGRLVRGTQGQEVLMKMAVGDYKAITIQKDAENRKNTFSPKANKAAILSAAAGSEGGGDQAAEFLNRSIQSMQVTDSVERVSLEE